MEQVDREMNSIILRRSYEITTKDFLSPNEASDISMLTNGAVQEICAIADMAR